MTCCTWSATLLLGKHCSQAHSMCETHDILVAAGRVLNVAVCAADTNEPPRVLNYLTGPNVVVWSAVACSSAFPYLFKPQELLSKNEQGAVVS